METPAAIPMHVTVVKEFNSALRGNCHIHVTEIRKFKMAAVIGLPESLHTSSSGDKATVPF